MDIPVAVADCVSVAPTEIVQALIEVESGGVPHSLTVIGQDGVALKMQPLVKNLEESISIATLNVAAGYTVKVGLMQVSSADLARFGIPLKSGFSTCQNILAGSRVYSEITDRVSKLGKYFPTPHKKTQAALSAYKTGSYWSGITNGYAAKVIRAMGSDGVVVNASPVKRTPAVARNKNKAVEQKINFSHDITVEFSGTNTQVNWAKM